MKAIPNANGEKNQLFKTSDDETHAHTLFGVPEAEGEENTFPLSHILLMLRTPSAGTGRSDAAGLGGLEAFVP